VIVNRFVERAVREITLERAIYPRLADACVRCNRLTAEKPAATKGCRNSRSRYSGIGIKHKLVRIGESHDQSFRKAHRKLTGVLCFFNMIAFHVRNFPHVEIHIPDIVWILAQRVAGILALSLTSVETLSGIFRGNPNVI
jgi:hypothetical protein